MHEPHWEHFEHDADVGVRGLGATRDQAFEQAALALTAVITSPSEVRSSESVTIACSAKTDDMLLFEWLNAIVFEMATRKMLFGEFRVHSNDHELHATATGEPVDVTRHHPAAEVKGATCTELVVLQSEGGWTAQCVVDV